METNIVMVDFAASGRTAEDWAGLLRQRGIVCRAASATRMQLETNAELGPSDLKALTDAVQDFWPG